MNRRNVGWSLFGVAIMLALVGFALRSKAEDDIHLDREVEELRFGSSDLEANQVPSTVAFVAAGAAAIAAAVLLLSELPSSDDGLASATPKAVLPSAGTADELSKLVSMRERGELTEAEFEAAKRRLLGL